MDKATNKQKTLIHLALVQLNLGDDVYRDYLGKSFGVRSSKDLSYDQASVLIDQFKKWGFSIRTKSPCHYMCAPRKRGEKLPENVLVLVSPQQLAKLNHLIEDIDWKHHDGFARWLRKYYQIDRIRYSLEASRVMEGLKGLWRTQNHCECPIAKEVR